MKRISLLILSLLFLSTAFQGDNPPPGWYIQPIPVNKNIVDIYFTDTLHGWAVTTWTTSNDTAYILKTTNGGINWLINNAPNIGYHSIQFLDSMIGYACGGIGTGQLYKTTNSGLNWILTLQTGHLFTDLYFLNKDTGWVCDDDNLFGIGLIKTTNGGNNWVQQLSQAYSPKKLFFLNKDTGWVMTVGGGIYRTNNSGVNWMAVYNFGSTSTLYNMFFTSSDTGWMTLQGGFYKTINGGYNWAVQPDPYPGGAVPYGIFMINSTYGYLTTIWNKILKTKDGINWGQLNAPAGAYESVFFKDSLKGWSMHGDLNYDIASTTDGGGPITYNGIKQNGNFIPSFELGQNYPNPFNASTRIKFSILKSCYLDLKIFNIKGQEVANLISGLGYKPGEYDFYFDAGKYSLSSGVYFYHMKGATTDNKEIFLDTKRMLMVK